MASKFGLVFLVTLTAGIFSGNGVSSKITETVFPKTGIKTIPKNISELADLITLNETIPFWNQSKFNDCFSTNTYQFKLTILKFGEELKGPLKNFMSTTTEEIRDLVFANYRCVNENQILLEQARKYILTGTQKSDSPDKKLKRNIEKIKKGLMLNLMLFSKNLPQIRKGASKNGQTEKWAEIEKKYEEQVEKIKSTAIRFVVEIKQCMKKSFPSDSFSYLTPIAR